MNHNGKEGNNKTSTRRGSTTSSIHIIEAKEDVGGYHQQQQQQPSDVTANAIIPTAMQTPVVSSDDDLINEQKEINNPSIQQEPIIKSLTVNNNNSIIRMESPTVEMSPSSSGSSIQANALSNQPSSHLEHHHTKRKYTKKQKLKRWFKKNCSPKGLLSHCCRIAFLLPFLLVTIVSLTIIIVFVINLKFPKLTITSMNLQLTEEVSRKIIERLDFITSLPPKAVHTLLDLHYLSNFTNDLRHKGKIILSDVYLQFPEVSTVNIALSNTLEQMLYERLPNGTVYEGYRRSKYDLVTNNNNNKASNGSIDTENRGDGNNLYRYIVDKDTLKRIEGWGPTFVDFNYSCTDRPWFKLCKNRMDYWTEVTPHSTGALAVFQCSSIYNNNNLVNNNNNNNLVNKNLVNNKNYKPEDFIGVITVDFLLSNLNVFLKGFQVAKNGVSFIMERNGDLIASSIGHDEIGSLHYRLNVKNCTDIEIIRELGTLVIDNLEKRDSFSINRKNSYKNNNATGFVFTEGINYYINVHEYSLHENLNWLIVVAFPKSDFTKNIMKGYYITIAIAATMIITSIILSVILSKCFITKPLQEFKKLMKKVTHLNLEIILNSNCNNTHLQLFELKFIRIAFYKMICTLQSFRKFVPEVVIKRSLRNKQVAALYLVEKEICIFFMDFIEFTNLTTQLTPIKLIELISDALEELTEIIENEGGIIDKYIGDAIMALFNVPTPLKDFNRKACNALLKCIRKLNEKEVVWHERGLPSIKCRIGLHSGKALVGNFGSSKRLNYTAVGHSVNLAARLEPLCKLYGLFNLISETIYECVKDYFCCRFIDMVIVKGISEPVIVFSVLNERENATKEELEMEEICNEIKIYLKENNLERLKECLERALELFGNYDLALNRIKKRCELFEHCKENFNGILTLSEKSF
ncbi:hypothetical protein ABK040_016903 [Willaertia magna]